MRWLADLAYLVMGGLYLPIAIYNALVLKKNRGGWNQRFGRLPHFDPARPRLWIHAVSLGEINATPALVQTLHQRLPDYHIVFSTTTDTGFARAVQLYGPENVFRFPLDLSSVIQRALQCIHPTMIILVELEVWYNLIHLAAENHIPVVVVNGRLTQRSAKRLALLGRLGRSMFQKLTWIGAQDETIAQRFRAAGAPADRVQVTSSLKWDTAAVCNSVPAETELKSALGLTGDQPVWVCGSTGNDEEELLLQAYRRVLDLGIPCRLCLVPRKPERFDAVEQQISAHGWRCIRRSKGLEHAPAKPDTLRSAVILGDTMGELRKFYSLADIVFIGRSLVPMGGSDPMEAAALAKPLIAGPHMENFESPTALLSKAKALIQVSSVEDLAKTVARLCQSPGRRLEMGQAAGRVVLENQGATQRTADKIVELLTAGARSGSLENPVMVKL